MRFAMRLPTAALIPRFPSLVLVAAVVFVVAPAFWGGVAFAHDPATDSVAVPHHTGPIARRAASIKDSRNKERAPPVVVLLGTAELSRGPMQGSGKVTLPMNFGQPVAPEDELAATPAPPSAPPKHRGANHESRLGTHLATFSVPVTTEDGVPIPDLSAFVDPAT